MAVTYTYEGSLGTIEIDFTNQEINIDANYDTLEVQELNDAAREAEAQGIGCAFPPICRTSGKSTLDVDTGVTTGITFELLDNWLVYSEKTSGAFKVYGGNLIRADGEDPFKANPLVTYVAILSAASTIVSISTGSGLSTEEHDHLLGLPTDALKTQAFKDLSFKRQNTIEGTGINRRISQYIAGDPQSEEATVDVEYDGTGTERLPLTETPQ